MRFGVAKAIHFSGPCKRDGEDNQIQLLPINTDVEAPYIWHDGSQYLMPAKCMNQAMTDESGADFIATFPDGKVWRTPEEPAAYSKVVKLKDGNTVTMPKLERPQVLLIDKKLAYVYFACRNSQGMIFNMVKPLNLFHTQQMIRSRIIPGLILHFKTILCYQPLILLLSFFCHVR